MKEIFTKILAEIPKEELVFDSLSFAISQQIYYRMKRNGFSQKMLSEKIGCSEAMISKQLSGDANLTLKSIAKFLVALSAEMKIEIVDAGTEGFWMKTSKVKAWEKENENESFQNIGEFSPLAA